MYSRTASLFYIVLLACFLPFVAEVQAAAAPAKPGRIDAYGDPLPPGALMRLGTVRWRTRAQFLAFTPDGKTLVTAEDYATRMFRCWDTTTGKETGGFPLGCVWTALALSPDGKTLAFNSGGDAKDIVLARLSDGKEIRRFEGISSYPDRLQFSSDGRMLSALDVDDGLRLFDVESGKSVLNLMGDADRFRSSALSPDGTKLALVGCDSTLRVIEIASQKELLRRQVRLDDQQIADVKYSPDGKKLAWAGGTGRTLMLLDAATGEPVLQFHGSPVNTTSAYFSPDGKRIAATDTNGESIRLWDAETGKELRRFTPCRTSGVFAFSPDGTQLASADDWQGVVHLWDVATGKDLRTTGEHQGPVECVGFSGDGRTAVTGCADGEVRLWDVDKEAVSRRVKVADAVSFFCRMALSDDRQAVAIGGTSRPTDVYDLSSGRKRVRLEGGKEAPWTVVFAPDGKSLAATGRFPDLRLWDAESGKVTSRLGTPEDASNDFAYAPDGKTLAVNCRDPKTECTTIVFLEISTRKALQKWRLPNPALYHLRYSADGRILAASGFKEVRLWDEALGKETWPLVLSEEPRAAGVLDCLAFSPDGKTLAVGGRSGGIYLWEVATAKVRAVLRGHRAGVTSLDFSPDGARLLSGSSDTTALIWDLTGLVDKDEEKTLTSERLSSLWDELADADAGKAWRAGWRLAADPAACVPFLRSHVRSAEADVVKIANLLTALDGDTFEDREAASRELAKLGDLAEPSLRKLLAEKPSSEVRLRLQELVNKLDGPVTIPAQACDLRCVEVLEHIGSPEARWLLDELGKGAAGARLTREAKAALARLSARKEAMP